MKKVLALALAVLLTFSFCIVAMAADTTPMTVTLLTEVAQTKKLYAHVIGHTYENKSNSLDFDIYDDFASGKIACNFKSKNIQAVYDNGTVTCMFPNIKCQLSASPKNVPIMGTAAIAVEAFQGVLQKFLEDPTLKNFDSTIATVDRNGKTCTKETFSGKLVKVSGSFYYDADGKLCEIQLTDTLGASIGFNVENVSADFSGDVFTVPTSYFDLSILWKILSILFMFL